jgi:Cutinase
MNFVQQKPNCMSKMTTYMRLRTGNAIQRTRHKGGMAIARVALTILALGGALGVMEGTTAKTAKAAAMSGVAHHIINSPWYLHPGNPTDTPSISSPVSDLMLTGTEFDVQCAATGSAIRADGNLATDGNGDTAWEYGTDTASGNAGFVSDQGLDTQVTQGQEIAQLNAQGIPECGSSPTTSQSATIPLPCTSFLLIGVRGSGAPYTPDNNASGTSGFTATLSPIADSLSSYYGNTSITEYGLPYQAAPALALIDGNNESYYQSEAQGEGTLENILIAQEAGCPNQQIFLAGYSQGAEVVGNVISNDTSVDGSIVGVALYGDPRFNPSSQADQGNYDPGLDGVFGSRPEFPSAIVSKVMSYCLHGDAICNWSLPSLPGFENGSSPHFHYTDTPYVGDGAGFLESRSPNDLVQSNIA